MQPTVEHLNMSKWYSSFSSSQRRNHNALSEEAFWSQRNDTFFTIAFSRWNILLSRGLVDPLPFPSSAGVSRWKSIFSLLEKPVTTLNSRSESPEWHQTGQLQLRTPSQMFHRGPGAVPTTAGDLHRRCCASPRAPSCRSIAVCWGPGMFLTQLCSAGRFPMDWKRTADSTVTQPWPADNQKLPPHTLNWTWCPSFDPQLLPLALSDECKQSQLFQYICSLFFF